MRIRAPTATQAMPATPLQLIFDEQLGEPREGIGLTRDHLGEGHLGGTGSAQVAAPVEGRCQRLQLGEGAQVVELLNVTALHPIPV